MNLFRQRQPSNSGAGAFRADTDRLKQYSRFLRSYLGYSVRGPQTGSVESWRRLRYNFGQPIVNLGAGWLAGKPIDFEVKGDVRATQEAYAIWARSGSDAALLEAAICCGIYGDIVATAAQDDMGRPVVEFVDPSICHPTFEGADYSRLRSLEIAFLTPSADGREVLRREFYDGGRLTIYEGNDVIDERAFDVLPVAWIRNQPVKGLPFGMSDVGQVLELVEEYDHISSKQLRILDYYAAPAIVIKGVPKGDLARDLRTVIHLPSEGDAFYLEWKGNTPDVEKHLVRTRNAIAEVSQVPAVAFGQADSGLTSISGVALQILYGPLISKTHRKQASWGPSLEYVMWLALQAAGFRSLAREDVRVIWPAGLPVDAAGEVAVTANKVAGKLISRRTAMNNLGIEDPVAELKQIIMEGKLLSLVNAEAGPPDDSVAQSISRGMLTKLTPTAEEKARAAAAASIRPEQVDAEIAALLERFDAILEAETRNIEGGREAAS